MRALCLHAHYDDYEFTCGGLFELWRRKLGSAFRGKLIVCTDGKAGHQFRTREETLAMRTREQEESARIGHFEFESLRLPDGRQPREACLRVDIPLLAAMWKAIRAFEPDYIVCPPVAADPLAGVHVDHDAVGQAVRQVAYMINVPHAFTPEFPADERVSKPVKVPVILNAYDAYLKVSLRHDLAIDTESVFDDHVCPTSYCHRSQIAEWLPWVSAPRVVEAPKDLDQWRRQMRERVVETNRELGVPGDRAREYFCVTGWGAVPDVDRLLRDLPGVDLANSRIDQVRARFGQSAPTASTKRA